MTKFTPDFIAEQRATIADISMKRSDFIAASERGWSEALDEIERLQAELEKSDMNGLELSEKRIEAAGDLLEAISLWFFKREGMESPSWSDQFISVCQLFEPPEVEG